MTSRSICIAAALAFLGVAPAPASAQSTPGTSYQLESTALFEWGCFDLCACPIVQAPLKGSFLLTRLSPDPLFDNYRVSDVHWVAELGNGAVPIVGSGSYLVGGEFAAQHRMTLDLSVGGGAPQRFDSGLILGGGDFPRIALRIRIHLEPSCVDTVITVHASPANVGVGPEGHGLPAVTPNPFIGSTRVDFAVRSPGPVDVSVHDLAGRIVRRLVKGEAFEAGIRSITWDGKGDDGDESPPGLYYVRVRSGGEEERARVTKLR